MERLATHRPDLALIIVSEGTVVLGHMTGESIVVDEGGLFFLDGLDDVTLRAVRSSPVVPVATEREPKD